MVKLNTASMGDGTAIIFVHGLGECLESWSEQLEHFGAEGFRAVALDLRGHGHSEAGEARIEMEGFADDVLGALESLSIKKAHFCGLSMGAMVVLEAYKRKPETFLSMTLVSSLPQYPPAQTQVLEGMSMGELGEQVAKVALAPTASIELRRSVSRVIGSTNKTVYIQSAEAACARDYTPMLPSIKVPVLLVAGELDYIAPPQAASFMQKRIADSRLGVVRGAAHLPNREAPKEFDRLMDEFLSAIGKEATK